MTTPNRALSGILVVNKHAGVTSNDIVQKVRRALGTRQVGHTGTLDPMATGVLPVLVGRAVKASEFLTAENKRYTATMRLGITTDTEDTTGTVLTRSADIPEEEAVLAACRSMLGESEQIPPMYSAIKVGGKKLVDLAREGIEIERPARPITVFSIDCERLTDTDYRLDIACSKGTYIRTLCADIGRKLGCGAAMASLMRVESGPFSLSDAITVGELTALAEEGRAGEALLPLETFFSDLPAIALSPFFARLAKSGCELYQRKLGVDYPLGTRVRLSDADGFFALGEVRDYPDGPAIRVLKLFVL